MRRAIRAGSILRPTEINCNGIAMQSCWLAQGARHHDPNPPRLPDRSFVHAMNQYGRFLIRELSFSGYAVFNGKIKDLSHEFREFTRITKQIRDAAPSSGSSREFAAKHPFNPAPSRRKRKSPFSQTRRIDRHWALEIMLDV